MAPNKPLSQFSFALLVTLVVWLAMKRRKRANRLPIGVRRLPCVPSVPVLGSLPFMPLSWDDFPRYFMRLAEKYGNIYALYMGSKQAVILNGLESIREGFVKKSVHCSDRGQEVTNELVDHNNMKGIALVDYSEDFRRRRQMYLSILKQFGFGHRYMETRINVEVAELIKQARLTGGKAFDPNSMLHMCVVNVITSIMFGKRYEYEEPNLLKLTQFVNDTFGNFAMEIDLFPILQYVPPFRGRLKTLITANDLMLKFLEREVNAVLEKVTSETEDKRTDSFVRQFVEQTAINLDKTNLIDAKFDRVELCQTLRDIFIAGDDTTSTSLRWILLNLANNPDVQARLHREVDEVVGRDRMCVLDDEARMPQTHAFILETMRYQTVATISIFHATSSDTQFGDYHIPAKTLVIANIYSVHMDPATWKDPETFNPGRFIDEHGRVFGKERLIPFSVGKRSCLGELLAKQELFLFVAGIIQNFDVLPPEGHAKVDYTAHIQPIYEPSAFQVRMVDRQH